jgi:hypothetical protein
VAFDRQINWMMVNGKTQRIGNDKHESTT